MPADSTSTLGRIAGSDAMPQLIAQYAREQARIASESGGEQGPHIEALSTFAEFVASRSRADQRIYAIYSAQTLSGDSDTYSPGPRQRQLFGVLGSGYGITTPLPDDTLTELVGCAVDDLAESLTAATIAATSERDQALAEAAGAAELRLAADATASENEQLQAELGAAIEERDSVAEQVDHLEAQLSGLRSRPKVVVRGKAKAKAKPKEKPRRRVVDGHTGVYERETASGEVVYEIGYPVDGKTLWETIGTNLDEAVAARAALVANDSPEAVAA